MRQTVPENTEDEGNGILLGIQCITVQAGCTCTVLQYRQGVHVQYYSTGRVYMYSITVQAGCTCTVLQYRQGVHVQYYSTGRVYMYSITVQAGCIRTCTYSNTVQAGCIRMVLQCTYSMHFYRCHGYLGAFPHCRAKLPSLYTE